MLSSASHFCVGLVAMLVLHSTIFDTCFYKKTSSVDLNKNLTAVQNASTRLCFANEFTSTIYMKLRWVVSKNTFLWQTTAIKVRQPFGKQNYSEISERRQWQRNHSVTLFSATHAALFLRWRAPHTGRCANSQHYSDWREQAARVVSDVRYKCTCTSASQNTETCTACNDTKWISTHRLRPRKTETINKMKLKR